MTRKVCILLPFCLCVLLVVALADPAMAGKKKREKRVAAWPDVDLSAYSVLCIEEFAMTDPKASDRKRAVMVMSAPRRLAEYLVDVVEPELFDQVLRCEPGDDMPPNTVILRGEITQYKPGSAMGRAMLAGVGSAHLDFIASLVDAESDKELVHFGGNKTWAWGGAMGMSKGVEDLEQNLAYEVALYLKKSK